MGKLIYETESYAIRGAIFEVYKEKGCGFHEPIYQECLEKEMRLQCIPFEPQLELKLDYKGDPLTQSFKPDMVCYGKIIIELKAAKELVDEHRKQILNYLKASRFQLGLLVNFGHFPDVEIERFVNDPLHR